jgi:hypothetical protein
LGVGSGSPSFNLKVSIVSVPRFFSLDDTLLLQWALQREAQQWQAS